MQVEQLELFDLSETDRLRAELFKLKDEVRNLRRGIFARHDSLQKLYIDAKEDLEFLKKNKFGPLPEDKPKDQSKCQIFCI